MKLQDLQAPFKPSAIHWRVGSTTKDKKRGLALAYLDARDVMERLDEVCNQHSWQDSYVETPSGRMMCTISIRVDDAWVGKSDGAGSTDIEGDKGGISDAFKRAAVKWGIGRYLYDVESPWVALDEWKKIQPSEQSKLDNALGGPSAPVGNNAPPSADAPTDADKENGEAVKAMVTKCETVQALRDLSSNDLFNKSLHDLHPHMTEMVRNAWSARNRFLKEKDEKARVEASNDELTSNTRTTTGNASASSANA